MIFYAPLEIILVILLASPLLVHALRKHVRGLQLMATVLLMIYIVFAAKYFFFPILLDRERFPNSGLGLELTPVLPLVRQAQTVGTQIFLRQLVGNILSFVPVTFLCAAAYPRFRRLGASTLLALGCSVGIELIQFGLNLVTQIQGRAVSINDVLLNTLGGILGFACWRVAEFLLHRVVKLDNF